MLQGARGRLSQDLVALWVDEYGPALALMRRIFPPGLMRYLNVRKPAPITPRLVNASQSLQVWCACCLDLCRSITSSTVNKVCSSLPSGSRR